MLQFFLVLLTAAAYVYAMAKMGVTDDCDWAKPAIDWNETDSSPYKCNGEKLSVPKTGGVKGYVMPNFDPKKDKGVEHRCLNETIEYLEYPPLRGPHRPNWGKYGEYGYIPMQRWLHNLEHGSVVMLYEPCTAEEMVEAPINLLTWGAKLEIAQVDEKAIVAFIKKHALNGPEQTSKNGQYDTLLKEPSQVVKGSNINDTTLCPGM